MITREDAIKAGWEVNHHDTFDAYVFGNKYELWFHPTGEGITIDNLGSDEQVFEGNIPDYNALVLLMDWLGIKSSPPKDTYVITPEELLEKYKMYFTKTDVGLIKEIFKDKDHHISASLLLVDMAEWVKNYEQKNRGDKYEQI